MSEATTQPVSGRRQTMVSVQVMRGLASLAVVFYHTHLILAQPEYGSRTVFGEWASKGWVGVNFFFVLSGFIILFAHNRDIGDPGSLPRYLWRRFVRLYPFYWICLTAYIAASFAGLGAPDFSWDWWNLTAAYLLVGIGEHQTLPLKVAWTLLYEIRFYAIFALLLVSRRVGLAALGLWLVGIVVGSIFWPGQGGDLFSLWSLYFFVGMGAAWALPRLSNSWMPALLAAALVILGTAMATIPDTISEGQKSAPLLVSLAIGFTLFLLAGIMAERRFKLIFPRWMQLLGDASYAIYLVHSAVLSVVAMMAHRFVPTEFSGELIFIAAFVVSSAVGVAAHLFLERPLLNHMRKVEPDRRNSSRPKAGLKAEA